MLLQWSNSEIARFPGAADLRAESDNVRDETRKTTAADYRCLLFLSYCRAERREAWVRGDATTSVTLPSSL